MPQTAIVKPDDQVQLSEKEMNEELTRVITANDPLATHGMVIFNFADREFKPVPGGSDEHIAFHVSRNGTILHTSSDEAHEQKAYERNFKQTVDDRRRQRVMAAQEEGKQLSPEEQEEDMQRNQFNFTERAAQTFDNSTKVRVISTIPPESVTAHGRMTQWELYDAYVVEFDRMIYAMNMDKDAKAAKGKEKTTTVAKAKDPLHSPAMGRTLKVIERMVNQNAEDEIYSDFKYWEDPSDSFRENLGTCLPLWKFEDARTKRKMVTAVSFNPGYSDLFVVGYGSYDFMKQGSGLISVYSFKNVGTPEYSFSLDSGVMCLDFHQQHHPFLAVGCYDGTVKVFDVRRKENKHIFASDIKSGRHTDPVWEVKWQPDDGSARDLQFFSISSDGKVASWLVTKSELKMEVIMSLKLVTSPSHGPSSSSSSSGGGGGGGSTLALTAGGEGEEKKADEKTALVAASSNASTAVTAESGSSSTAPPPEEEGRSTGLAGGCCFAFNPFTEATFLVGTEEGRIHRCSLDYSGQYLQSYEGHHMAVYSICWNNFHPRVFLSSSADWTVRLWDTSFSKSIMSFDVGTSVGDVTWAPYSSTVFAACTDEGKVHVWDLYANKHDHLCQQKIVKKAKCTHVAFHERAPLLLVGDSYGAVTSLKLSPNLRKVTPIPIPVVKKGEAPPPPPSRLEVEIRKMDKLLAASDAKITIVTPLPGKALTKKAADPAAAVEE